MQVKLMTLFHHHLSPPRGVPVHLHSLSTPRGFFSSWPFITGHTHTHTLQLISCHASVSCTLHCTLTLASLFVSHNANASYDLWPFDWERDHPDTRFTLYRYDVCFFFSLPVYLLHCFAFFSASFFSPLRVVWRASDCANDEEVNVGLN